jgi:hypothetical protein
LKISETIGDQAKMGQKLEASLGASNIASITSEISQIVAASSN